jgi:hypothetical protein
MIVKFELDSGVFASGSELFQIGDQGGLPRVWTLEIIPNEVPCS